MCDSEANFAEVRGPADNSLTQPEIAAEALNGSDAKKIILVIQKDSSASDISEPRSSVKVAVAYEFDSIEGTMGRTQARPIRLMESHQTPSLNTQRRLADKSLIAYVGWYLFCKKHSFH